MGTDIISKPAYLRIADQIEQQIRSGQLKPGEKLESIRQLAKTEGVSINTVRSAMEVLSQTGLVISLPRKGLIVKTSSDKPDYQPFEQFEPDARLARQSREWLNTAVTPDKAANMFVNMVVPADNLLFKSYQRHYRQCLLLPPKSAVEISAGNMQLREKLAQRLIQRHTRAGAADIQITNGCQNATEHALRVVTQPGDVVAVPTPAFPGYLALMSLLKLKTIEIPMTPCGPDPVMLKKVMGSKQLKALIVNPICHNPTGISLSDNYKRDIAQWANEYRVAVIEDDICADLSFFDYHPRPVASFDKQGWIMLVSSISKIMGDSERIGWCFARSLQGCLHDTVCHQSNRQFLLPAKKHWRCILTVRVIRASYGNGGKQSGTRLTKPLGSCVKTWVIMYRLRCLQAVMPCGLSCRKPLIQKRSVIKPINRILTFCRVNFLAWNLVLKNYLRLVIVPPYSEKHEQGIQKLAKLVAQNL